MIDFGHSGDVEQDTPPKYFLGGDLPEELLTFDVSLPSKGYTVTVNESLLVRGDRDKNVADEFWYNHLNGNGVLDLIAQLHAIYFNLCEDKDAALSEFRLIEAEAKRRYKLSSSKKITQEVYEVVLQLDRENNVEYFESKERLEAFQRSEARLSRTLSLLDKVYEVARTRNANARALQ